MIRHLSVCLIALSFAVATIPSPDATADVYDGVLSLSPVEEHSCLAVAMEVTPGQPISGISWVHNDLESPFPNLLVLEGVPGMPPDLSQTALVLEEVGGETLSWADVTFETPITSSTGLLYAVFQLPAFTEQTAEGFGGGPGIGYVRESEPGTAYMSLDGAAWAQLHPDYSMRVTPVVAMAKGAGPSQSLQALRESRPPGWWDEVATSDSEDQMQMEGDTTPIVTPETPLAVMPNPFNPRATVRFYVGTPGAVSIDVVDVRGRRVRRLLRKDFPTGVHEVIWQGVDDQGASVASGVYFLRMESPDGRHRKRAVLVR